MSTLRPVYWNDQTIMPLDMDINQLLYAIRQNDNGLILDSCSFADIYEDSDGVLGLDAMVTPFAYIERKMAAMRRVLDSQGGTLKVDDMAISDPFTGNGTVNVAVRFVLSDGQTISVYFHNPDTTPKKVLPTDEMISWKWLINKKDLYDSLTNTPVLILDCNKDFETDISYQEEILQSVYNFISSFDRMNITPKAKQPFIQF